MFSNSYLTDMKDGRCDVTVGDDSRMSELSRYKVLTFCHILLGIRSSYSSSFLGFSLSFLVYLSLSSSLFSCLFLLIFVKLFFFLSKSLPYLAPSF